MSAAIGAPELFEHVLNARSIAICDRFWGSFRGRFGCRRSGLFRGRLGWRCRVCCRRLGFRSSTAGVLGTSHGEDVRDSSRGSWFPGSRFLSDRLDFRLGIRRRFRGRFRILFRLGIGWGRRTTGPSILSPGHCQDIVDRGSFVRHRQLSEAGRYPVKVPLAM